MSTREEMPSVQPKPDVRTRPMWLQKRLGGWLWVAIAVVFIALVVVIFAMRGAFM